MKIAVKLRKLFTHGFVAGLASFAAAAHAVDPDSLLSPDRAFALETSLDTAHHALALHFTIAPGYYLYRERITAASVPDGKSLQVDTPPGIKKEDPNFGTVEIYHGSVQAQVGTAAASRVRVTWQGCAEAGVCFPPQTREIDTSAANGTAGGDTATGTEQANAAPQPGAPSAPPSPSGTGNGLISALHASMDASDASINDALHHLSPAVTLAVFFALGLALAFTPCMLPMLPVVTSLVVGARATRGRGFMLSLVFVAAMALVYAGLGVIAAVAGHNVQILLQQWWINALFGAVLAALALAMFGFYTLQLPAVIRDKLAAGSGNAKSGTVVGAAVSGIFSALLVGPCMTAPLAGTLLYIAQSGNLVWGAVLLLTLGIGLGVPFLIIGTLGARFMPRPGAWMNRVNIVMGFALLATSLLMLDRVLPPQLSLAAWGAWLIAVAMTLARMSLQSVGATVLCRSGVAISGVWGGAAVIGALAGATSLFQPLALFAAPTQAPLAVRTASELHFTTVKTLPALQAALSDAQRDGRVAMVDFSADWCTSCKTIDHTVFTDPRAIDALQQVALIKVDVTQSDADSQAVLTTFNVIGPPTLMFFGANGAENRQARLVGEMDTAQLLATIADVSHAKQAVSMGVTATGLAD